MRNLEALHEHVRDIFRKGNGQLEMKFGRDIKDNKSFVSRLTEGTVLLLNEVDDLVTYMTEMLNALFASVFTKVYQGRLY